MSQVPGLGFGGLYGLEGLHADEDDLDFLAHQVLCRLMGNEVMTSLLICGMEHGVREGMGRAQ